MSVNSQTVARGAETNSLIMEEDSGLQSECLQSDSDGSVCGKEMTVVK